MCSLFSGSSSSGYIVLLFDKAKNGMIEAHFSIVTWAARSNHFLRLPPTKNPPRHAPQLLRTHLFYHLPPPPTLLQLSFSMFISFHLFSLLPLSFLTASNFIYSLFSKKCTLPLSSLSRHVATHYQCNFLSCFYIIFLLLQKSGSGNGSIHPACRVHDELTHSLSE